jgi:broad specificity phosphatase PhoE
MMFMAKLILVKHAPPKIDPAVASPRWVLSDDGRDRCGWLADALAAQGVGALYSSLEPKALETAALTGVRLGLEVRPRPDLHENDRTGLGFGPIEDLEARIRAFFERPSDCVIGRETAHAALARFETAIRAVLAETADQTVAVIAHGTVLTLLTARHNPVVAFDFWKGLGLPSLVMLDRAALALSDPVQSFPKAGA